MVGGRRNGGILGGGRRGHASMGDLLDDGIKYGSMFGIAQQGFKALGEHNSNSQQQQPMMMQQPMIQQPQYAQQQPMMMQQPQYQQQYQPGYQPVAFRSTPQPQMQSTQRGIDDDEDDAPPPYQPTQGQDSKRNMALENTDFAEHAEWCNGQCNGGCKPKHQTWCNRQCGGGCMRMGGDGKA